MHVKRSVEYRNFFFRSNITAFDTCAPELNSRLTNNKRYIICKHTSTLIYVLSIHLDGETKN